MVSTWNVRCGIATYTSYLSEELVKQGNEVIVLSERKDVLPNSFDPDFPSKNIPFFECWSRNESFENLIEVVKKEIDTSTKNIVHIQHQFGLFPFETELTKLYEGLKSLPVTIVTTLHDVVSFVPRMEQYFNTIIAKSNSIIAHNNTCKYLLEKTWNCPPEKINLIYHGTKLIDLLPKEKSLEEIKRNLSSLNFTDKSKVLLSWGFLWESKGVLELVEIFSQVLKKYPETIFIHGGGLHPMFTRKDYLETILKKAFTLGIRPSNFVITGFVKEEAIPTLFSAADVIVLNYTRGSASASGAAHRAVASGRPIIKTDDLCLEEIPGYVCPRFDKKSLLKGIFEILENDSLSKDLVKQELELSLRTSWEETAKLHSKVYLEK